MLLLVAAWAVAEAILFFIVADVPISIVAVRWGWRRGCIAALVAALAATAGGLILYVWAAHDPLGSRNAIEALPAIDGVMIDSQAQAFAAHHFSAMLKGSISGIPYKIYAWAAGSGRAPLLPFLLFSPIVRLPRFLASALLSGGISKALERRLGLKARFAILASVWVLFYAVYFARMPG